MINKFEGADEDEEEYVRRFTYTSEQTVSDRVCSQTSSPSRLNFKIRLHSDLKIASFESFAKHNGISLISGSCRCLRAEDDEGEQTLIGLID